MNIQIKIQTFFLLIVACTQCMESEILTLDSRVTRKVIKVTTEQRFHIPGFSRQRDKIVLLQQLADQGAFITFSSKDRETPSWLHEDIDTTQKILYKFFSFLRYNKNTAPIAAQYYYCEDEEKPTHIFCLNNDALWITAKKSIKNEQQIISDLCKEYAYNNETTHTPEQDPDQNTIDTWHRYLQLVKNEIESIQPIQLTRPTGNTYRDQGILQLSASSIKELIENPDFQSQINKLKLLLQLVYQKVDITFNNEDLTHLLNQDIKTFKEACYDKLLDVLNYDNNSCQAAAYNTSLNKKKGFMATICLNNSLLHMVGSQQLKLSSFQQLENFLHTYHIAPALNIPNAPQTESTIEIQEMPQLETENKIYKKFLLLDTPLLEEVTTIIKKNEFNKPYFSTRLERLHLLQKLANYGVQITFTSEDEELTFWLDKEDPDIYQKVFYDRLFSFLGHTKHNQQHCEAINTVFEGPENISYALYLMNSLLYITTAKILEYKAEQLLAKFLQEYGAKIYEGFEEKKKQKQDL